MGNLSKHHQFLEKLINFQVKEHLNKEQRKALYVSINSFLKAPDASDYTLGSIAVKIVKMGVDYEAYVSALMFKTLPDEFTKGELVHLEDEFYTYIEKEIYGKGLDMRITQKLIEQISKQNPTLNQVMAEKKAMGNWGWLLPHALTQLVIEQIIDYMENAKIEASRGKRKGRKIRIKKMD
ncbi:MAG: hypothetical protein KZQ64_10990 [gamma proteobacterium symbiont of Bathyaustriella thionipta]|nr:hypothetical protein [gamma proteobacterium symbiont of Bathyaustriella thionipta]MCU7950544.1 hypothetical protein [gamma proteobacterium symbiont of Bathyaustriella thionipta]MCU7953900.1 hypothetical protein [gamma proteobacterium symbiont of Bathyaustriella thionipta]MCU7957046.1 hypothetical protein [gamma proteobacterium symbiont of Bathyaustriella thionipta]MCU7965866.1 hypothetical protein [gamma proteobacterium symbiont of Bathyaustriella thionipta]